MKLSILLCLASTAFAHSSQCGVRLSGRARIIGGNHAPKYKWPWQILIKPDKKKGMFCGGTVIGNRWVLTAAHCIEDMYNYTVHGGISHTREADSTKAVMSVVLEHKPHPSYNLFSHENDIAILKLKTPLKFDHRVSPICLPSRSQPISDDGQAVATGFGQANVRGTSNVSIDGQLREVILPIVRYDICKDRYVRILIPEYFNTYAGPLMDYFNTTDIFEVAKGMGYNGKWTRNSTDDGLICAGSQGHSVGGGDSGGPLMMKAKDGRWFQIGELCLADLWKSASLRPEGQVPAGFVDLRKQCDWIEEVTEGEVKCEEKDVTMQDVEIPY